jgi:hypothetical protein
MKLKIASVLSIIVLLTLAFAPAAGAQSATRISALDISLWPEYDKPGILVIYTGQLAPDTKLPVKLTFAIPAATGGPSSTAGIDAGGAYRYLQYETVAQGDKLLISYTCPYPTFQFEYYWNPISGQGSERKIDYAYTADYAIDALTIEVQQPIGASDLTVGPATASTTQRENFTYKNVNVGALPAGQTTQLSIAYRKADDKLSAEALGLPTPAAVSFEDAAKSTAPAGLPTSTVILISVTIVAVAAVVGVYIWASSRNSRRPAVAAPTVVRKKKGKAGASAMAQSRPTPARPAAAPKSAEAGVFCHQCGRNLRADETFCPACGARRKGA